MDWLNEPAKWTVDGRHVFVDADPNTDFWSITDYGKEAGEVALTVYMEFNGVPQ